MNSTTKTSGSVSFAAPRSFGTAFKSDLKETFFPDDPFKAFANEKPLGKVTKGFQYFVPILGWLPKYSLKTFQYDVLAALTITSLAIPQGISYAKLCQIPPIIGLYSSFVPPLIYAIFGDSKYLAVGTVAACSLLIAEIIGEVADPKADPTLYLHLVFTATFITGIIQTALGILRLGILVDFLSHSTITGFMGGTAIIICLQQLKGFLGLKNFTTKTDVVNVLKSVFQHRNEWRWESAVLGITFLLLLQFTRWLRNRKPKLFWVSAMTPLFVVVVGCLIAYFAHAKDHGIPIVGDLKKGINPSSIQYLTFDKKYFPAVVKAAAITGLIALAEGIAIGRSFAIMRNEQVDGNKEMIAFGFMNIIGSFTSCYLTTGPFSKTAVNYNAGARSQMTNAVMALFMMIVLLFLAPLFSYTPLVALSAIIMSAMLGLIKYNEVYELFKVDKFDFVICMAAVLGVAFISMDIGLGISIVLGLVRALLYVARPGTCKLGKIPDSVIYRDIEQYPEAARNSGVLVLQIGSPVYFANGNYIRERILRWVWDEQEQLDASGGQLEHVLLELSGVITIDMTGIETLAEVHKTLAARGVKMGIINPRIKVMEKIQTSHFVDKIGKENIYLSIEDAIVNCKFSIRKSGEAEGLTPPFETLPPSSIRFHTCTAKAFQLRSSELRTDFHELFHLPTHGKCLSGSISSEVNVKAKKIVFVTVGTASFDALVREVDMREVKQELAEGGDEPLAVDYTFSSSIADHLRAASLVSVMQSEFAEEVADMKHLYYARPRTLRHVIPPDMNLDSLVPYHPGDATPVAKFISRFLLPMIDGIVKFYYFYECIIDRDACLKRHVQFE
ncbi:hypothetical protein ACFX2C_017799 [Malus domestica]